MSTGLSLRVMSIRSLIGSSIVRGFIVTGMYSTFFLGTLYLEQIRHFTALQTGLAFLPWTLTVAALSMGVTARVVARFGPMRTVIAGMALVLVGLGLNYSTSLTTAFFPTLLFAYLSIGLGIGLAFMPLLQIGMADVPAQDAGLGSGIINVSQQIAGAFGLALLSTVATNHSKGLIAAGHPVAASLLAGYHLAYIVGGIAVAVGIVTAIAVLHRPGATAAQVARTEDEPLEQLGDELAEEFAHAA